MMRRAFAMGLVLLAGGLAQADVSITACGAVIPRRETGILSTDLACAGSAAVTVEGATLDLAGHTITSTATLAAVECEFPGCTIVGGGGTIVAGGWSVLMHGGRLRISGVSVDGAIQGNSRVDATQVRAIGRGFFAVVALKVRAVDVDVSDSGAGIMAINRFSGERITANNTENNGIAGGRIRVTGLVAHGNLGGGVNGRRVALVDSDVTGNGLGVDGGGVDVWSESRPRLLATACGKSADGMQYPSVVPWGVCLND